MRLRFAVALLTLLIAGCLHRGAAWSEAGPPAAGPIELFVLGQVRESSATRAVAGELERSLREARAQGRNLAIIVLGTDYGPAGPDRGGRCPDPGGAYQSPALAELARTIAGAIDDGASAWGLPGPDGWRCHQTGLEAAASPLPFRQPGFAAVLRVSRDGELVLASSCDGRACTLDPADADASLVELVLLDTSIWHYPGLAGDDIEEVLLAQQASLLDALAAADGPPRILVSPIPIESAGSHGLGGRRQRTAFHYQPPFVQQAVAAGLFAGAIGALERDLQIGEDISNAILRVERSFIDKPVFQIVSGSAGGAGHTLPTSRGMSLLPDLHGEQPGFVSLSFTDDQAIVHVHARVSGRWRVASLGLPLRPAAHPALRETPTIQPCPSCDPQRGASDGDVFVPRSGRPH